MVRVYFDGLDDAHWKATRIDLIAARAENLLAGFDAIVRGEIVDQNLPGGAAAKDGADARGGEENAGA